MFKNTPFESIVQTMSETASKLNPASVQEAIKPVQDNLQAWAELAQSQAKEAQAVLVDTVESVKNAKSPQEALEVFIASAQTGMALFAKNLQEATSLSVAQFHGVVDAVEKNHPAPDAFSPVAKNLKAAATSAENTLDAAVESGTAMAASVAPGSKTKRPRK